MKSPPYAARKHSTVSTPSAPKPTSRIPLSFQLFLFFPSSTGPFLFSEIINRQWPVLGCLFLLSTTSLR